MKQFLKKVIKIDILKHVALTIMHSTVKAVFFKVRCTFLRNAHQTVQNESGTQGPKTCDLFRFCPKRIVTQNLYNSNCNFF